MKLKTAKFAVRVAFTTALMIIGTAIYFTSKEPGAQILGTNMVTAGWATWMSTGKVKSEPEPDVENP